MKTLTKSKGPEVYQVRATGLAGSLLIDSSLSEKAFQDLLVNAARVYGWRVIHIRRSDGVMCYDSTGATDLTLVHSGGGIVMAECKALAGRVSPKQEQWAAFMKDHLTRLVWRKNAESSLIVPTYQLWAPTENSIRLAVSTIMRIEPGDVAISRLG